jgi:hypothetical protein
MLDRPGVLIRRWREPEMLHFCDLVCRGGETIRVSVVGFRPARRLIQSLSRRSSQMGHHLGLAKNTADSLAFTTATNCSC